MNSTLSTTFLILLMLLPFLLKDGRRYRVMLIAIILLMPFYQTYIYLRYFIPLLFVFVVSLSNDRQILSFTKEPINRSMMVFFITSLVSAILSSNVALSITPLVDLVFFYLFFLICLLVIGRHLTQPILPTVIMWVLIASVFIQFMQLLGVDAFYIYSEEKLNGNTGIGYTNEDRILRFWGPFGNSLTFSAYLAAFGMFLFGYYNNSLRRSSRFMSYGLLAVAIYGIMLTAGRTALASMLVGLLFFAFLKSPKKAFWGFSCIAIILFLGSDFLQHTLLTSKVGMFSRFLNLGDDKSYRTEIWGKAFPIFLNNPIFGTGPGNLQSHTFPIIRTFYSIADEKKAMTLPWGHVENSYLSVLYTFGLAGFSCFVYMIGQSFLYSLRFFKKTISQPLRQLSFGISSAWVVIWVNMFTNPAFITDYRIICMMLLFVAVSVQIGWTSRKRVKHNDSIPQINNQDIIYA